MFLKDVPVLENLVSDTGDPQVMQRKISLVQILMMALESLTRRKLSKIAHASLAHALYEQLKIHEV